MVFAVKVDVRLRHPEVGVLKQVKWLGPGVAIIFGFTIHYFPPPIFKPVAPHNVDNSTVVDHHIGVHAVATQVGNIHWLGPFLGGERPGK